MKTKWICSVYNSVIFMFIYFLSIFQETEILVANDIVNIEAVRFQLKSPHDENVVTHFEAQETMLDYVFSHLGVNTPQVDHPIILTEAFCNPNYSRQCKWLVNSISTTLVSPYIIT